MTKVYIEKVTEDAIIPTYAHENDAGMDVYSNVDVVIAPGETVIVPAGIKLAIPDGYEIQVRPRSGLSAKTPLRVCNAPGTIDTGYRDEVGIIMQNTSERYFTDGVGTVKVMDDRHGDNHYDLTSKGNKKGWYEIHKGDRVAQIVLQEIPKIEFVEVDNIKDIEGDRNGGFGSTGVQ